MRNTELEIINTDIPQLATSVDAKRLESLTGYPLAQLCAWDPFEWEFGMLDSRRLKERRQDGVAITATKIPRSTDTLLFSR